MQNYMTLLIISFFISMICLFAFRPLAQKVGLVDKPCTRKRHQGHIPLVGGISIFVALCLSVILFLDLNAFYLWYLLSALIIVLLGVIDDIKDINPLVRLSFQILVGLIIVLFADLYITGLGNLFGVGYIHLGSFALVFTLIAVCGSINAFNMVDGVDGLVGGLSLSTFAGLFIAAILKDASYDLSIPAILIGAVFAFLILNISNFNLKKHKVFMGDSGSTLIGLTVIWLLIIATQGDSAFIKPVTALWLIAIPLIDMISVIIRRVLTGHSPLGARRDHIHHLLIAKGYSPRKTTGVIFILAMLLTGVGIVLDLCFDTGLLSILAFVSFSMLYHTYLCVLEKKYCN